MFFVQHWKWKFYGRLQQKRIWMSGFDKTLELQIVFLQVVCIFITIFFLFFEKWYKTLYFSSDTGTNFCFFSKVKNENVLETTQKGVHLRNPYWWISIGTTKLLKKKLFIIFLLSVLTFFSYFTICHKINFALLSLPTY